MRRFYIFALTLLAFSIWIVHVDAVDVDVPDETLNSILKDSFGLGAEDPITDLHLRNLTELLVTTPGEGDPKIADLTGLEEATRLTNVILSGHSISDLTPLESWENITALDLGNNSIANLNPLKELTTLETLYLNNNEIVDVQPLAGLTSLVDLKLSGNDDLEDTSPLAWLPLTTGVDVDIPPAVRITDVPEDTQSEAFNVTITFSEDVTGFGSTDISLTGDATAMVTTLTGSGS